MLDATKPMNYWSQRSEAGSVKARNAIRKASQEKWTCSLCSRTISILGRTAHQRSCSGPSRRVQGHTKCGCGQLKALGARCCAKCSGDSAMIDALIIAGRRGVTREDIYR